MSDRHHQKARELMWCTCVKGGADQRSEVHSGNCLGIHRLAIAQALAEAEERGRLDQCACLECGKPSICFGKYDGGDHGFACDECCGHFNEDGWCVPLRLIPARFEASDLCSRMQESESERYLEALRDAVSIFDDTRDTNVSAERIERLRKIAGFK